MRITPMDIQQQQFKTRPFGYDKGAVDTFLEQVADELESVHRRQQELKEEMARLRATAEEMRQREATLKETLLTTQRMTDEIKANARKEAEILIADAGLRGERIVRDAEERRIQLITEIQELRRQKVVFETGVRNLVEGHLRLLDLDVVRVPSVASEERLLEEKFPFSAEPPPQDEP